VQPQRFVLLPSRSLDELLEGITRGRAIYAPRPAGDGRYRLERADRWVPGRHTLGAFRTAEPLKALLFPPREYLGPLGGPAPAPGEGERVVLGVKACDVASLAIHDFVFKDSAPADPTYVDLRERTYVVAADCTDCLDVCFCTAVGQGPHAETGYDLNVAMTSLGPLIEIGSERGRRLLEDVRPLLAPASAEALAALARARAEMAERVASQAERAGLPASADLPGAVRAAMESGLWAEFAETCVECGACNFVCCTCHCFALADGWNGSGRPARTKLWDSCLYRGFARVAGGGSPRQRRAERLRNRFDKKFVYFPEVLGHVACDGCGRCTEACAGAIDVRAVLKRAIDESQRQSVPAHSR
jgi:ferredoxin